MNDAAVENVESLFSQQDLYLFNEGSHLRLYDHLGAHPRTIDGVAGCNFAVWAPGATYVSVVGDFNCWDRASHSLTPRESSGIWEGFLPGVPAGTRYKYFIDSRGHNHSAEKADPVGFFHEVAPKTGSIVWDLDYAWNDTAWMARRRHKNSLAAPLSIYEVHFGSWRHVPEDGNRSLSYREMAEPLARHMLETGFTHVEFMPLTEHPFYGSWGYQATGFFAPTSRFGSPQDFMYLVDYLHQHGLGVIIDWVPSHFPNDEHGLAYFDGSHLFEHADPQQGFHPDWKSCIFNYGRHEVRAFLLSSALFWLDKYHIDGIRVDAVASMLYLDYSRKEGEWVPNHFGGNENLSAIYFLRRFNEEVFRHFPDVQTFAEESTAWPMVSRPTYVGGLGFGFKWDMGWMHDTLHYLARTPIHRQFHHNEILFRMVYAFSENYVLPLSHDEVVHGKGSLLSRMPGDCWQQFAGLRLLYGYQWAQPGKKLLFMGGEIGQGREWNHNQSLDWDLLASHWHAGILRRVSDLNRIYQDEPALHDQDCRGGGFESVDCSDAASSIVLFLRKSATSDEQILVVCNFTPVVRFGYRVGVPYPGHWRELLNGDATIYAGSGQGNYGGFDAETQPWHGRPFSAVITVPPLSVLFFKGRGPFALTPPAGASGRAVRAIAGPSCKVDGAERSMSRRFPAVNSRDIQPGDEVGKMRRSWCRAILPLFACLAVFVGAASAGAQGINWQEDYARGRVEAVAKGRPLMVTIVSASSERCRKWMDTTLADPAVVAAVASDFLPVRLEAARSATYVKALGLRSFPITIFAAPDGSIVHAVDGDADAKSMVVQVQVARSKLRKPQVAALPVSRAVAPPVPAPAPLPAGLNAQAGMGYYQPMAPWWNAPTYNYPPAWGGYGFQGYAPQQNVGFAVAPSQPLFAPGKRSC